MSVILTAARKKPPKSARPKKKRHPPARPNPAAEQTSAHGRQYVTPPVSSESTVVWHWELDGVPTTVMFSKERNEVWCNGEVVDQLENFAAGGSGATIDFVIITNGNVHRGRIKRAASGSRRDGMTHQLFVDGYMILEHTTNSLSPYDAITPIEDDQPPTQELDDIDNYRTANSYGASARYMGNGMPSGQSPFASVIHPPPPYDYNAPRYENKKDM